MKTAFSFFCWFLLIGIKTVAQINGTGNITSGGISRTFTYHLPTNIPACNLPVIIAFHGDGGTGAGFQSYAGLDAIANTQNFIVIYPDAKTVGGTLQFNKYADASPGFGTAGDPNFGTTPDPNAPDDVQFTSDLIDYLYTTYKINRNQVYATGHSGGAFMCYFLAVALANKIAAIAPVAGSLWINNAYSNSRFAAQNYVQMPILHLHSKGDGTVPPPIANYPQPPAYVWPLSQFAGATCNNSSTYSTTAVNANADLLVFCSSGKQVKLIMTKDATHGWPTAVNAPQQIWDFVKNFSLTTFPASVCSVAPTIDIHIKIDQFGYTPDAKKIAIIANPQTGYNSNLPFTPGNNYQIRRLSDNVSVFNGTITSWNAGATHSQSGDKVWWFDFSSLCTVGEYYVYDVSNNVRSYTFEIRGDIYRNTLKQATRTFYYQRCGCVKTTPFAQSPWTDGICHTGVQQDNDCRLVSNTNISTSKNLSGGWHDAGDYNKYVPFVYSTLVNMCLAYEENPSVWTDDFNLPESNNGIPDLLDEIKYETDWLLKMQQPDGSVLHKISVTDYSASSPPSADIGARRYGTASTLSSITASAVLALAAIQFKQIGQTTYANTLQMAAINAWNWSVANPSVAFNNAGFLNVAAESSDPTQATYDRLARKVAAAAFLYALTGNATYKTFFEANYTSIHLMAWSYAYPFESTYQDALLYYTKLVGVTSSVKTNILNTFSNSMQTGNNDNLPNYLNNSDAYRAYLANNNYTWGSNQTKADQANMLMSMNVYNQNAANATNYRDAGFGFIHYFHGVNPTSYCYLSNMGAFGAEYSVPEIYHGWFNDGTIFDTNPAPGFVVGGANPTYAPDGSCNCNAAVTPPLGQPIQKSYKSWNTGFPQNSWEFNEPAIYQQAAYLRILSKYSLYNSSIQSIASGNWNAGSTWSCGRVPTLDENVIINTPHNVALNPIDAGKVKNIDVRGFLNFTGNASIGVMGRIK